MSDFLALIGNDDDGCVFLQAVDQKIDSLGGCEVSEYGIESADSIPKKKAAAAKIRRSGEE